MLILGGPLEKDTPVGDPTIQMVIYFFCRELAYSWVTLGNHVCVYNVYIYIHMVHDILIYLVTYRLCVQLIATSATPLFWLGPFTIAYILKGPVEGRKEGDDNTLDVRSGIDFVCGV